MISILFFLFLFLLSGLVLGHFYAFSFVNGVYSRVSNAPVFDESGKVISGSRRGHWLSPYINSIIRLLLFCALAFFVFWASVIGFFFWIVSFMIAFWVSVIQKIRE